MTTTIYPLTDYHYPTAWAETFPDDGPRIFVGEIGASDVDQVQHVLTHNLLNDPIHFHRAFPMWAKMIRDLASADDDTVQDAYEVHDAIRADVDSWLAQYEGVEWDGGEPYRIV